jgi:hypothetical protein
MLSSLPSLAPRDVRPFCLWNVHSQLIFTASHTLSGTPQAIIQAIHPTTKNLSTILQTFLPLLQALSKMEGHIPKDALIRLRVVVDLP